MSLPLRIVLLLASLAVFSSCQKNDDHPPYAAGCQADCAPMPGISIGSSGGNTPTTNPDADAGTSRLTGEVQLLTDQTFVHSSLFTKSATVSATGAGSTTVSAVWDGADPYQLEGVASLGTNWLSVKPDDVQGDALETYQAVATQNVSTANLAVISATTLDDIFSSVAAVRSPEFGQVVLFFRSTGTNAALSGLHVAMPSAQVAAYASNNGWTADDGTATTDASGLVFFGNVELSNARAGTQTVTVSRAATATSAAVSGGTFSVKVVARAATIASVNVQL